MVNAFVFARNERNALSFAKKYNLHDIVEEEELVFLPKNERIPFLFGQK